MEQDVTRLLSAARTGDRSAVDSLYRAVYAELHRLALSQMRREGRAPTLQPTALVNEAYLRLAPGDGGWQNRRHFFAAAAESMRRILVDHARSRLAQKRGAEFERVTLSGVDIAIDSPDADVLELDAALTQLGVDRPRLAELVTLRFFAGLSIEDAARALEISPATAKRDWQFARVWLRDQIEAQRRR